MINNANEQAGAGGKGMKRMQALLDMYKNAEGARDISSDRKLKTYNLWSEMTPTSEKSKQRQAQFKGEADHYKRLLTQNAIQMGLAPEEISKSHGIVDNALKNIDKMSFSDLQKLDDTLRKNISMETSVAHNSATAEAGKTNQDLNAMKFQRDVDRDKFDNYIKSQRLKLDKEESEWKKTHNPLEYREADKKEERAVEDFDFQSGKMPTSQGAATVAKGKAYLDQLLNNLDSIEQTVEKDGVSAQSWMGNGEKLRRDYESVTLLAKELFNLGVLQKIDEDKLKKLNPDPASAETYAKEWVSKIANPKSSSNYLDNIRKVKGIYKEALARKARAYNYDDTPFRQKYGIPLTSNNIQPSSGPAPSPKKPQADNDKVKLAKEALKKGSGATDVQKQGARNILQRENLNPAEFEGK